MVDPLKKRLPIRYKLHSKWVKKMWNYTRNESRRCETTLETSGEDVKLHSKRVKKMWNYTRNEWRICETTLEKSLEDVKLHSKRVEKMRKLHSKRVKKMWNYTRKEWRRLQGLQMDSKNNWNKDGRFWRSCRYLKGTSFPLVSSVFLHLPHSFRVYFYIFSTRFECIFTSSPLVSSVFLHLLHSFRV